MGRKSNTYRCHFCKNRFYKTLGVIDKNKDFICNICLDQVSQVLATEVELRGNVFLNDS